MFKKEHSYLYLTVIQLYMSSTFIQGLCIYIIAQVLQKKTPKHLYVIHHIVCDLSQTLR